MAIKSLAEWRKIKPVEPRRPGGPGRNRNTAEDRAVFKHIGSVVREMRGRLGLTAEEVGATLSVTRAQICNLELGNAGIGISRIPKLAASLGIPVSDLLPPEFSK